MNEYQAHFFRKGARFLYREESTSDLQVISEVWTNDVYRVEQMLDLQLEFRTILDVGANIGAFTVLAYKCWPEAEILAVEPEEGNFSVLEANLEANTVGVRCERYAVTDQSEGTWLNPYFGNTQIADQDDLRDTYGLDPSPWRDFAWGITGAQAGGIVQQRVPSKTLDQALDDLVPGGEIDLLKMDIEGAELEVFRSFDDWQRVRYITMECHSLDNPATTVYVDALSKTHDMIFVSEVDVFAVRK